jgi:hypothetical protein
MIDLGTVKCQGVHPGDITEEIISRIVAQSAPLYSMAQVTLDGLSREHGKGIDMKSLAAIREQLLDLKIRMKTDEEDKPVPLQQDIRMIDYLAEFDTFIGKRQMSAQQREFVGSKGREVLQSVMDEHRETAE